MDGNISLQWRKGYWNMSYENQNEGHIDSDSKIWEWENEGNSKLKIWKWMLTKSKQLTC